MLSKPFHRTKSAPIHRPSRARPRLEALEDRTLLSFARAVNYPTDYNPQGMVVADFNSDRNPDVITASRISYNNLHEYLGSATGALTSVRNLTVPGMPTSIATADFNRDDIPDLAVGLESGYVDILLGNGDGTFRMGQLINVGAAPSAIAVGDLLRNGIPDLVVSLPGPANQPGRVAVMWGNGNGTFQSPKYLTVGVDPSSVMIADLTNNGIPDLLTTNTGSNNVSVLFGMPNGSYGPLHEYAVGPRPSSLAIADVNHDGNPDMVVTNANGARLLLGNGRGGFSTRLNIPVTGLATSVALADIDRNGLDDMILTVQGKPTDPSFVEVVSLRGPARARYSVGGIIGGNIPVDVAVSDLNNDGRPDLLVLNSVDLSVLLNTTPVAGEGEFENGRPHDAGFWGPFPVFPVALAVGDLTHNGRNDVVTANDSFSRANTVLLGEGPGPAHTKREH